LVLTTYFCHVQEINILYTFLIKIQTVIQNKILHMKKIVFLFSAVLVAVTTFAQTNAKKAPSLAIHYAFTDYKTASDLRSSSLVSVLNASNFYKAKLMSPGLAISYMEGFTPNIDFAGTLTGTFVNHPTTGGFTNTTGADGLLLEAAGTANFKLLTDNYFLSPYITVGIGASKWQNYYSAFIPVGLGLQSNLGGNTFVFLNSQYRIAVTENAAYHLYHSIGVGSALTAPKAAAVPAVVIPVAPVVLDTDGDGVNDTEDKCPTVAGLAALNGCPDRDSDGIADADDKCPNEAGLAKYGGCPIPDTDGDGVNDEEDKCINEKGFARYQGCPIPDTDGDAVNDEDDKCKDVKGTAANQGCPEISKAVIDKINYAAKNVFFATGSSKLLAKSNASLNEVVKLLKSDESLMIDVSGHTDATGKEDKNQTLSEARAKAVKDYLVSKGIAEERLASAGFGSTKPVADNKTAAGKAKNRRTELSVRNF
jgi:OmpA-OmpF porin, OOP family